MKSFFAFLCTISRIAAECSIDGKIYKVGEKFTKSGECLLYICEAYMRYSVVA